MSNETSPIAIPQSLNAVSAGCGVNPNGIVVPIAVDSNGYAIGGHYFVGQQGNLWNNINVAAESDSAAVDLQGASTVISIYGNASGATTLVCYVSADGANFYNSGQQVVIGSAGDFHLPINSGARFFRLRALQAVQLTATISSRT